MNKNLFVYHIDRKDEIEKNNFVGINRLMKDLESMKENAFQSLALAFNGYDYDYREVYEIEEVRKFVDRLFYKFPHILYFVNFEMKIQNYLLPCICDIEVIYKGKIYSHEQIMDMYLNDDDIPEKDIYMNMDHKKLFRIKDGLRKFGNKINDSSHTNEIIDFMDENFN